jgi:hypothetical protein
VFKIQVLQTRNVTPGTRHSRATLTTARNDAPSYSEIIFLKRHPSSVEFFRSQIYFCNESVTRNAKREWSGK